MHATRAATVTILVLAAAWGPASAQAPVPLEPEKDNSEYVLDLVTSRTTPGWRDAWDSGDNRFRLRLGSNNVAQWFLEEELEFAADLVDDRLRLRWHHARLHRHSTRRLDGNTLEFEVRIRGVQYLSLFVTPDADKADNAVGLAFQDRRAVDRFTLLFVEFPHVVRNYTERETGGGETITVFSDRPVRYGLRLREESGGFTLWCDAEFVPRFVVDEEDADTERTIRRERVLARSVSARLEYAPGSAQWKPRWGLEGGSRLEERVPGVVALPVGGSSGAGPAGVDVFQFDDDLYRTSADDSITGWQSRREWLRPYAWYQLAPRWTVHAALHIERREIRYPSDVVAPPSSVNRYLVPTAAVRFALDPRARSTAELGWASSHRERKTPSGTREIDDHRIILCYEYAFTPTRRVRLIETLELDRADRGDYGLHDHAFVQVIAGF